MGIRIAIETRILTRFPFARSVAERLILNIRNNGTAIAAVATGDNVAMRRRRWVLRIKTSRIIRRPASRLLRANAHKAFWGAEVAAQRMTGYLRPEHFTLYVRGDDKPLLIAGRMRLDLNGNTELLQAFWNFPANPDRPDLVPPLPVYADLMATRDGRNLETARFLYERLMR